MSLIRRTLVTALVLSLVGAPGTTTGRGLPSLADYPLMVDTAWLWGLSPGAEDPDDPAMPTGTWTITPTPIRDGILELHVRVRPPSVALPVQPGPAILFSTVGLSGGLGGDVGFGRLVSVGPTFLPACTGEPCTFEADVSADLRRLPRLAARVRGLTTVWAALGFTLLRTFGAGTWLQELSSNSTGETVFSGTLRHPLPWNGRTPHVGLFPAAGVTAWREDGKPTHVLEALHDDRLRTLDESVPPTTADVRLVATFVGCDYPDEDARLGASLRTAAGDLVTIPRAKGRDFVDVTVPLPSGTTWRVGWQSVEVHPDGTRDSPPSMAAIAVKDQPLLVTAAYRCRVSGATPTQVAVAEVIATDPSPQPSASPAA